MPVPVAAAGGKALDALKGAGSATSGPAISGATRGNTAGPVFGDVQLFLAQPRRDVKPGGFVDNAISPIVIGALIVGAIFFLRR